MKQWIRFILICAPTLAVATRSEAQLLAGGGGGEPIPAVFRYPVFSPSGAMDVVPGQRATLSIGSLSTVEGGGVSAKRFSGSYALNPSLHVGLGISRDLDWRRGVTEQVYTSMAYAPSIAIVPVRQGGRFPVTVFATANLLLTLYDQAAGGQRLTGTGYGLGGRHTFEFARGVNIATYASYSWAHYAQSFPEYTSFETKKVFTTCNDGRFCETEQTTAVVNPAKTVRGSQGSYTFGIDASVTVRPGAIVFAGPMIVVSTEGGVSMSQAGLRIGIAR